VKKGGAGRVEHTGSLGELDFGFGISFRVST
jgi:hypothetical protein